MKAHIEYFCVMGGGGTVLGCLCFVVFQIFVELPWAMTCFNDDIVPGLQRTKDSSEGSTRTATSKY